MENEKTEAVAVVTPQAVAQVAQPEPDIVRFAVQSGAPIETIERMVALVDRQREQAAEREYFKAMNAVQREMLPIVARSKNQQTNSKYAKLEAQHLVLVPCYTAHGFSISFGEADAKEAGKIRIEADVMHRDGHHRMYHNDFALDSVGIQGKVNKTELHGKGSTISYGRRYLEMQIFNLTISGEDTDGARAAVLTDEHAAELVRLCSEAGVGERVLCDRYGASTVAEIPETMFRPALASLEKSVARKRAEAAKGKEGAA